MEQYTQILRQRSAKHSSFFKIIRNVLASDGLVTVGMDLLTSTCRFSTCSPAVMRQRERNRQEVEALFRKLLEVEEIPCKRLSSGVRAALCREGSMQPRDKRTTENTWPSDMCPDYSIWSRKKGHFFPNCLPLAITGLCTTGTSSWHCTCKNGQGDGQDGRGWELGRLMTCDGAWKGT